MTKQHEKTLEKICEKRGFAKGSAKIIYTQLQEKFSNRLFTDEWLLGFLCSKETLVACFGEEYKRQLDGEFNGDEDYCVPELQYHGGWMVGMTAEERLDYYGEYLEVKE